MLSGAKAGFSLLEAIVAVAIIGIVAVGALAAAAEELDAARRSALALEATSLAEQKLEELRVEGVAGVGRSRTGAAEGRFASPLDGYSWRVEITHAAARDLLLVEVRVRYAGGEVRVETYLEAGDA